MSSDLEQPAEAGTAFSRRTLLHGAAWAVPVVAVAVAGAPALAASPGCLADGTLFNSISRGRMLSGSLLGTNLDNVLQLNGVIAEAKTGTPNVQSHTVSNPLTVEALNAILLNLTGLGNTLSDVLNFVAPAGLGALNEYAYAHENGDVIGASGAVSDQGVVDLSANDPGAPALGTLDLHTILENLTGPEVAALLALITDLQLQIGAVTGKTSFNSLCYPPEDRVDLLAFDREYLLAYLRLLVDSPALDGVIDTLQSVVSATLSDTGLVEGLLGTIESALSTLPGVKATASLTVDTTPLTTSPIPAGTDNGFQLHLGNGTLLLDLAPLLGLPNGSSGLNGLAPNTRLFADAAAPTPVVVDLADSIVDSIVEALKDLIQIDISVNADVGLANVQVLTLKGSLREFLEQTATINVILLGPVLNPIVESVVKPLLATIGNTVLDAVKLALDNDGVLNTLAQELNTLLAALFDVLTNVIVVTVNAQNNVATNWMPNGMASLTTPGSARYDVAALHIGALSGLDVLDLFLARGSGGENMPRK